MNQKLPYMLHGILMLLVPKWWCRWRRKILMGRYDSMSAEDRQYIDMRTNYYCQLLPGAPVQDINEQMPNGYTPYKVTTLGEHTFRNKVGNTVYFFDTYEYTRCFPDSLRWLKLVGDVFYKLPTPAITKSRLIHKAGEVSNEVIINQDKVRHFCFINDPFKWEEKKAKILFRGACHGKPLRENFVRKFIDNPLFDIRDTAKDSSNPPEWQQTTEMTLYDHLPYRYIMALEGNDVASNLKWVMSSNSIAISTPLTCETWFMEGKLIPNYHYIEIKEDFSDLIDKISYYESHPEEAKAIVEHAHEWCAQFQDKQREDIIALKVFEKYFKMTGQM